MEEEEPDGDGETGLASFLTEDRGSDGGGEGACLDEAEVMASTCEHSQGSVVAAVRARPTPPAGGPFGLQAALCHRYCK